VSWNGATDLEMWIVYINSDFQGRASRQGFETLVRIPDLVAGDCITVGAVERGVEVRRSSTECLNGQDGLH
jgi:hypothetical protein